MVEKHASYKDISGEHEKKLSQILFGKQHLSEALNDLNPPGKANIDDKKPAWEDDDDENVKICKKKAEGTGEHVHKYSDVLKRKFNNLIGTPNWARLDIEVNEDSDDDDAVETVGHLFKKQRTDLRYGTIEIKRYPKLNAETHTEGPIIKAVEFHPTSSVGLVAGYGGIASLFAVSGRENTKLHSVSLPDFKIHTARFSNSGNNALLGSNVNYFFVYDLMKADVLKVCLPRAVVATTKSFETSRCGKYVAVAGRFGEIHLLCANSRELLSTLKQSNAVTAITFDKEGKYLFSHSDSGFITVWNLATMRPEHKWADDGCIYGSSLALCHRDEYFVSGSGEGVANVYNFKDIFSTKLPKPVHSILNLNSRIDNIRFNSTSEILGISSSVSNNGIKLIHVPSFKTFSNFPGAQSNFKQINCFNFSPNSGFLALGNNKNSVYLQRLKHYSNY